MGKLKPIGSEKLEGMDKIKRMIEISRYNENIPQPINEDKSIEYNVRLSDGNKYSIVKEKVGYVIKKSLNESNELDYMEPMKNRKYYPSYSQAFKRLNLIAKEVNKLNDFEKNISLFTESDEKFFIKVDKEINEQPAPAPVAAPSPAPAPAPQSQPESQDIPLKMDDTSEPTDSTSGEEVPSEPTDAEDENQGEESTEDEMVTFKTLQKLTGKLSQKIREFLSNEENTLSSKDIKYIINSVLSALELNNLDEDDKEEIMTKFEGEVVDDSDEVESSDSENMDMDNQEVQPDVPQEPQTEVTEYNDNKMEEFFEGVFSESKIDKVIGKYFQLSENEKKIQENSKLLSKKIRKYSTSILQEVASKKFVKQNPEAQLIGRTKKNNLVFNLNEEKVRISPNGNIL